MSQKIQVEELLDGVLNVLRDRILNSEYANEKTRIKGRYISPLICPVCGKAEAWTYADKPLSIICNRKNNCGERTKTTTLFNIFENIAEKYPPTPDDPHRPAKQFLRARGISEDVIQKLGVQYHADIKRGGVSCGPAAMFRLGEETFNGRLFRPPAGQGKTHNIGRVGGKLWRMPGMEYQPDIETFVVEGILDALSLICMGCQAIAILGAGFNPAGFDLSEFKNLVFAFDNDPAGHGATRQWMDHFKDRDGVNVSAILPLPGHGDFNDFLCNSQDPDDARTKFDEIREKMKVQGRLALADNAFEYASIYWESTGYAPGLFAFDGCYHFSFVKDQHDPEKAELKVSKVSNFTVDVVLSTRSDEIEDRPVYKYQLKIKPKKGRTITVIADANDLKSPDAMKGFFLRHGRAHWYGSGYAVDGFIKMVVESNCPVVRQMQQIGYDHQTGFFILKDIAFDTTGKAIMPDKGLIKAGIDYIRPAKLATIKPLPGDLDNFKRIYGLIRQAWGDNGCIALSFLCASLFVNQVKEEIRFFPFLSLYGDPQTGKTRLVTILNNIQGLDGEGLPMTTANTKKGELRKLSEVSGMMKALIEGNNPTRSRFDFESILPLYNYGNPLHTRALQTNDNQTKDLMFYGSLAFVQNMEPFQSRAAKERVVSLKFTTDDLDSETKAAFDELSTISSREYAGFLELIFSYRQDIEKYWFSEYQRAKTALADKVPDNRINENHAILLAFHRLLCGCLDINHDLQPAFESVGSDKMQSCRIREQTLADLFFDYLDALPDCLSGHENEEYFRKTDYFKIVEEKKLIYINLPRAKQAIAAAGFMIEYPGLILNSLQEHPAYIQQGKTRFGKRSLNACVFDIKRLIE